MTRMTLTVAAILVELSRDAHSLPAIMLASAVARAVADLLSPSFDHGMLHQLRLPFLDEVRPPPHLPSMLRLYFPLTMPQHLHPHPAPCTRSSTHPFRRRRPARSKSLRLAT
jgi:hypothetical protein